MAIRNNLLGGTDYIDGEDHFAEDENDTNNALYYGAIGKASVPAIKNLIRQLQDRSVVFSADGGEWAEVYTSAGGRKSSVDLSQTDAQYNDSDSKYENAGFISHDLSSDTTHNPDSFTNPEDAFNDDETNHASIFMKSIPKETGEPGTGDVNRYLGKTFSQKYIYAVNIQAFAQHGYGKTTILYLESYDGSDWVNEKELTSQNGTCFESVILDKEVQGLRLRFRFRPPSFYISGLTYYGKLYRFSYGSEIDNSEVRHIISKNLINPKSITSSVLVSDLDQGSNVELNLFGNYNINSYPSTVTDNNENVIRHFTSGTYIVNTSYYRPYCSRLESVDLDLKRTTATIEAMASVTFYYLDGTNETEEVTTTSTTYVTKTINNPYPNKLIKYIIVGIGYDGGLDSAIKSYITNISFTPLYDNNFHSGWVDINKINEMSESLDYDNYVVSIKLIPKETSPTPKYPAIYGTGLIEVD